MAVERRPMDLPREFVGAWTTRNCATFWVHQGMVDCDRWGDDTTLRLEIPAEGRAVISVVGVEAQSCIGKASDESTLVPPQPGAGTFLLIRFEPASCGLLGIGDDMTIDVYRARGQDEPWIDDDGDGWGHKMATIRLTLPDIRPVGRLSRRQWTQKVRDPRRPLLGTVIDHRPMHRTIAVTQHDRHAGLPGSGEGPLGALLRPIEHIRRPMKQQDRALA